MPSREQWAFDVFTLYAMLHFLGRASMVDNLETNFATALQIGFGKATRGVKSMQKVFRKRRSIGGKNNTYDPLAHRDEGRPLPLLVPCLFILLHKG